MSEDAGLAWSETPEGLERALISTLLEPHRAYVSEIAALREAVEVHGMAHITGGGLPGNLPRCLNGHGARLYAGSWEEPPIFALLRARGNVSEDEMRRVFNLGVGYCAVLRPEDAQTGLASLEGVGCEAWAIGEVIEDGGVRFA